MPGSVSVAGLARYRRGRPLAIDAAADNSAIPWNGFSAGRRWLEGHLEASQRLAEVSRRLHHDGPRSLT